eukprot:m.46127 g.46127  ORF g.46127 m.46127 type:complete len:1476 (+) comp33670_c0_seq3:36-4463(+)
MESMQPNFFAHAKRVLPVDEEICVQKLVQLENVKEKLEPRGLIVTRRRIFILSPAKGITKVETNFHFLAISRFESVKSEQLTIAVGNHPYNFRVKSPSEANEVIASVLTALRSNLPQTPLESIIKWTVEPAGRGESIKSLVASATDSLASSDAGPCGGFAGIYSFLCNYFHTELRAEVEWDINTIYHSHGTKQLALQDFDHLDARDLVPIIASLAHNSWFTKLSSQGIKLSQEAVDAVAKVLELSPALEELCLEAAGLTRDSVLKLGASLQKSTRSVLRALDFSSNAIDDKGVSSLAAVIGDLDHGLEIVKLAKVGLTARSVAMLSQALKKNEHNFRSLKLLKLSDNQLNPEGITALMEFLICNNVVQHLDLTKTSCALEKVFDGLLRGCCHNLQHLDLSFNRYSVRKAKDVLVPEAIYQFFSKATQLKVVSLSHCKFPPEALKAALRGLSENNAVSKLELNLSHNELGSAGAAVLISALPNIHCLASLDLTNNDLEGDMTDLCKAVRDCPSPMKKLKLGENFRSSQKGRSTVAVEAVSSLLSSENCGIEVLSVADSKLKQLTANLLDALSTCESIIEIDISGNAMGDRGARMLARALQVNATLRTIYWDKNGVGPAGFRDVAVALKENNTLLVMPTPLHDAASHLREGVQQSLLEIQNALNRNHSVQRFDVDQTMRRQEQIMISTTQQQLVDREIVDLQDIILSIDPASIEDKEAIDAIICEANKTSQLLMRLHSQEYEDTLGSLIRTRLLSAAKDIHQFVAQTVLQDNSSRMLNAVSAMYPSIVNDELKSSMAQVMEENMLLPLDFINEIFTQGIGVDVIAKVCQVGYEVALELSEVTVDTVKRKLQELKEPLRALQEAEAEKAQAAEAEKAKAAKAEAESYSPEPVAVPGIAIEEPDYEKKSVVNQLKKQTVRQRPTSVSFDDLKSTGPKLDHLTKGRPRPKKRLRPTARPSFRGPADIFSSNERLFESRDDDDGLTKSKSPPPLSALSEPDENEKEKEVAQKEKDKEKEAAKYAKAKTLPLKPESKEKDKEKKDKEKKEKKKKGSSVLARFTGGRRKSQSSEEDTTKSETAKPAEKEDTAEKQAEPIAEAKEPEVKLPQFGISMGFEASITAELKKKGLQAKNGDAEEKPKSPEQAKREPPVAAPRPQPKPRSTVGVGPRAGLLAEMKKAQERKATMSSSKTPPLITKPKPMVSPRPVKRELKKEIVAEEGAEEKLEAVGEIEKAQVAKADSVPAGVTVEATLVESVKADSVVQHTAEAEVIAAEVVVPEKKEEEEDQTDGTERKEVEEDGDRGGDDEDGGKGEESEAAFVEKEAVKDAVQTEEKKEDKEDEKPVSVSPAAEESSPQEASGETPEKQAEEQPISSEPEQKEEAGTETVDEDKAHSDEAASSPAGGDGDDVSNDQTVASSSESKPKVAEEKKEEDASSEPGQGNAGTGEEPLSPTGKDEDKEGGAGAKAPSNLFDGMEATVV